MAAAGDDLDAFMEPDLRFHRLLLEAGQNELLEHMNEIFTAVTAHDLRVLVEQLARLPRPPGGTGRS
jgi:DNA-binding FadR family transcriptional regulator